MNRSSLWRGQRVDSKHTKGGDPEELLKKGKFIQDDFRNQKGTQESGREIRPTRVDDRNGGVLVFLKICPSIKGVFKFY